MDDLFKRVGSTQTLSSKIERNIEKAIREKKLKVGDKLPSERELCEMFAVSRTALREALRRLSARGLIEIKKGSGMYVKRIKMEDAIKSLNLYYDLKFDDNLISNIISVRKHFEPVIAYMAALQRSEKSLELMEKNIADFEACDPDNTQLESDLDNKFHSLIAYATDNPIVIVTTEPIHSLLPRMRNYVYANIEGVKDITLGYHKGIYKAIKEQDAERAQELMQAHANRDADVFNKFLKKSLPNE